MKATRIQIAMDSVRNPANNKTTAGPLAIILARLLVWMSGEELPRKTITVLMDVDWSTLEEESNEPATYVLDEYEQWEREHNL